MIPGEWLLTDEPLELNAGRPTQQITVRNTGELTVQVGSHYHFFEVNRALSFDRRRALGMRLNIPAGQAIRFDPGSSRRWSWSSSAVPAASSGSTDW